MSIRQKLSMMLKKKHKICGVYKIESPKGHVYIGQSLDVKKRLYTYSKGYFKTQLRLKRSIEKYGWDKHSKLVLIECAEDELNFWEAYYIDFYSSLNTRHGLNLREAGNRGRMSISTKRKLSLAHKGKKKPSPSSQTREKLRQAFSGIPREAYVIEKIKNTKAKNKRQVSEETRNKMRNSAKGNASHCKKIIVSGEDYDKEFKSIIETANHFKRSRATIHNYIKGKHKHKSLIFKYKK